MTRKVSDFLQWRSNNNNGQATFIWCRSKIGFLGAQTWREEEAHILSWCLGLRVGRMAEREVDAAVLIRPVVQNYDWGVRGGGNTSLVARMAHAPPRSVAHVNARPGSGSASIPYSPPVSPLPPLIRAIVRGANGCSAGPVRAGRSGARPRNAWPRVGANCGATKSPQRARRADALPVWPCAQ
jgi:hypothetical protein